jgi:PadR family transcriptional regulator, regulatory protein PadR
MKFVIGFRYMSEADNDLFAGLIRLHVLHHAAQGEVFGLWIIRELQHHGYDISPGTIYPMLHGLQRRGHLSSREARADGRSRRMYRITPAGRTALAEARQKVKELFGELFEEEVACNSPSPPQAAAPRRRRR